MKIIIVTFCWPPRNSIGAHRPYSWAKYWAERGANVTVLTAKKYSYDEPLDLSLPLIPGVSVIEVDYRAKIGYLANILIRLNLKRPLQWLYKKLRDNGKKVINPRDAWFSAAVKLAPELARSHDVVVSTYDPKAVHLIAAEIKKNNKSMLWVADYRDLWCLNHATRWSKEQRALERQQELNSVGAYADILTTVSAELANDLRELHGKEVVAINNGFDIALESIPEKISRGSDIKKSLSIVYTGKLYPKLRNPMPLLKVIKEMEDDGIIAKGAVAIEIFGGQQDGIFDVMKLGDFDHIVRLHGHVSRNAAIQAQENADLLLLLESSQPEAAGVLTGKVYEYMASGVPIISLGSRRNFAIGKILAETKTGICTEDDPVLIRSIIESVLSGSIPDWFSPDMYALSKYSRKSQANKLFDLIRNRFDQRGN